MSRYTITEIAKLCGTSPATVSRVLNNPDLLWSISLDRVRKLQEEAAGVQAEHNLLLAELETLMLDQQRMIPWARKGRITETDLAQREQSYTVSRSTSRGRNLNPYTRFEPSAHLDHRVNERSAMPAASP